MSAFPNSDRLPTMPATQMYPDSTIDPVPPCRVLMRDGVPCDEWITERPRKQGVEFRVVDRIVGEVKDRAARPAKVARPVPPPRPLKPLKPKGPRGWSKSPRVTIEKIRELQAQGLSARAIAEKLGCSMRVIYYRTSAICEENPAAAEALRVAKICPKCGKPKQVRFEACGDCRQGRGRTLRPKRISKAKAKT